MYINVRSCDADIHCHRPTNTYVTGVFFRIRLAPRRIYCGALHTSDYQRDLNLGTQLHQNICIIFDFSPTGLNMPAGQCLLFLSLYCILCPYIIMYIIMIIM